MQEMFLDGTFSEVPKPAEELGLKEPDPPKPPHIQFRICRIECFGADPVREERGHWRFTLPLSTRRYDSVKQAYDYLQKQAASTWAGGPGNSNQFWIQPIIDGKFDEVPKSLEELKQSEPTNVEAEPQQSIPTPMSAPVGGQSTPEWLKSWI